MTVADNQAIAQLSNRVTDLITENREAHKEIKEAVKEIGGRVDIVEDHCKAREVEMDRRLAARTVTFEAELAAAKLETKADTVAELRKPGIYALATKGAFEGLVRFSSRAAIVFGLVTALYFFVDKVH